MQSQLDWIQKWFSEQCDGVWEHSFGISIETLDNPGWRVKIDLAGTPLENLKMEKLSADRGEDDWVFCTIRDQKFEGHGDPMKLVAILEAFREWATSVNRDA